MARTVVVLGASFSGIPVAHYLLKHTAAKVKGGLKVILVSPNTDLFWCVAAVRAIVPGLMPDEKVFYPIAPSFAKYPASQFEFVQGKAQKLDPGSNSVIVRKNDGSEQTIKYNEVVIATGASYAGEGPPFKDLNSTQETKAVLHEWSKRVQSAKSIVIAGAGPTGVEVAGELGEEYASKGLKEVTLIADGTLPLPSFLKDDVRQTAKKELENNKVKVIVSSRVTRTTKKGNQTVIELNGGKQTITTDLFIPTFGVAPNTSFLPPDLLDDAGFVKQTKHMRAEGHKNIYVVGDAGNLEAPSGYLGDLQVQHLVKVLEADILGGREVDEYKIDPKIMLAVTLGKNRATGQVGNWRPWSILIWYMKGRHLGTDKAHEFVNGSRTLVVNKW